MSLKLLRLAGVVAFALATGACSTIDDMISDDTPASADAGGFPAAAPSDATTPPADAATPPGDGGAATPGLATIPDRPTAATSPDDQRATADALAADRARAHYSADALRGGTEAAAAPPGPPSAEPVVAAATPPPPAAAPPAPAPATPAVEPSTPAAEPAAAPTAGTLPAVADNTPPASSPAATAPAAPYVPPSPPAGAEPAVPATAMPPGSQRVAMADAPLGFRPSTAPPLDPSISNFVPAPIVARYRQTAALTPGSAVSGGGAYGSPVAVVLFAGDGTALSAKGRSRVREAVAAFKARGGSGYIKVVGHSSSRTPNMPLEKHMTVIFNKSEARANAVAREIIREGVPANQVLVEAVGDAQPVYYESMPQGEAGNRRAEIFIQG